MIDFHELLASLAKKRPIFHSEADFQHALAWSIHQQLPGAHVRLEVPFRADGKTIHLDLWVTSNEWALAVELKYKTSSLSLEHDGEQYQLQNHSAQDGGRYDFLKDLQRLEQITSVKSGVTGYAILLTNDSSYWKPPRSNTTVDSAFRIHHGRSLSGLLHWGSAASSGTTRSRELPINLENDYQIHWSDYSELAQQKYTTFRFVVVKVTTGDL